MRTHSEGNALQTPDTRHQPRSKASSVRGSRIPDDWSPDEKAAAEAGLTNGKVSLEAAKFRDYWTAQPGQKGVKTDWAATWRNWCRKAAEFAPAKAADRYSESAI